MATTAQTVLDVTSDCKTSGVSWGSIFAGAAAAAALSLLLLILGVGLGLSAISPWSYQGITTTTVGISSIVWLTFTHIAASGMGGYLSGRLRIRWVGVHSDEVYFRDTAHGLLAWAVASLLTAALLGSVVGNIVSIGVSTNTTSASDVIGQQTTDRLGSPSSIAPAIPTISAGHPGGSDDRLGYWIDSLFRFDELPTLTIEQDYSLVWLEASRIFASGLRANGLPAEDQRYLAQMITRQTGLATADAEKRVAGVFDKAHIENIQAAQQAKQLVNQTRKTTAYSTLWTVVALLLGAFVASLSATLGGKQRDRVLPAESAAFS
ncbi:MAG: hypothetical protein CTY19_09825 [Methylomonas sp.]|nr:MAG: hypothetical protein CTY19_09825 [Methylomonas sp.]